MAELVTMPKLSDTMTEGVIARWAKKEGDPIQSGEVLAEIETDKATMEFESYDSGVVLKILVAEGQAVPLNAPIAIIGEAGEDISAMLAGAASAPAAMAPAHGAPAAKAAAAKSPAAKAAASEAEADEAPADEPPDEPAGETPSPVDEARPAAPRAAAEAFAAGRTLTSPLAARLALEAGLDLRQVRGTGPGGRIVKRDVEQVIERGAAGGAAAEAPARAAVAAAPRGAGASQAAAVRAAPPVASAAARGASTAATGAPPGRGKEVEIEASPSATQRPAAALVRYRADSETRPLSMLRKTIARRMVEVKAPVPHFYLTADIDMAPAVKLRKELNAGLPEGSPKISINDLVIVAAAQALRAVPEVNSSFGGDHVLIHHHVDIGVAVAIEDGLVTPVVRDADLKRLSAVAAEVRELAERARVKKLRPEEMTGSTFSISNLGMFGIEEFGAIINPPEAAILAVGAAADVPVVQDGKLVIGTRMKATLSCDHRVLDGAVGARWLQAFRELLRTPMRLVI